MSDHIQLRKDLITVTGNSRKAYSSRGFIVDGQDVSEGSEYSASPLPGQYRNEHLRNQRHGVTDFLFFKEIVVNYTEFFNFGDGNILKENILAQELSQAAYDFMYDTAVFITGGRRRLALAQWAQRLVFKPQLNTIPFAFRESAVNNQAVFRVLAGDLKSSPNLISAWIACPNGMSDMLYSAELIFGAHQDALSAPDRMIVAGAANR